MEPLLSKGDFPPQRAVGQLYPLEAKWLVPVAGPLREWSFLEYRLSVGGRTPWLTPLGFLVFQIAEPEACDEMYESLARLHSNYYKHKVSGPADGDSREK